MIMRKKEQEEKRIEKVLSYNLRQANGTVGRECLHSNECCLVLMLLTMLCLMVYIN